MLTEVEATSLLVTQSGIYLTEPDHDRITYYDFKNKKKSYHSEVRSPTCLGLFAEQTFLYAAGLTDRLGYSYRISPSGTLEFGQPYIHYHLPYGEVSIAPTAMAQDNQGLLYTLTAMGIQVTDQLGRVNLILELPDHTRFIDMTFGGNELNELYMLSENGRVFKRVLSAKGVLSWQAPVQPPRPGL